MKKIIGIVLALFLTINCFAKEIEMQIVETEFGIEISNLDGKGKKICKGYLNTEYDNRVFVIFKKSSDNFNIEELVNDFVYNNYLSDYLIIDNGIFKSATIKDSKVPKYGPLVDYDSLLIIPKSGKFSIYRAICDGKNLNLWISGYIKDAPNRFNQKVQETIKEKEKKEAEREAEREREAVEYKIAIEKERVERERIGKLKDKNERKKIFEQNGSEGYDYFVFGTPIEDFLIVYPEAKEVTEKKYRGSEYKIFEIKDDKQNQMMYYYFFEKKLFYGETLFRNVNDEKSMAINYRLQELYGKYDEYDEFSNTKSYKIPFDDYGRTIDYKEEGAIIKWNKTSTFVVKLEITGRYGINTFYATADQNTRNMLLYVNSSMLDMKITYCNIKIQKDVDKYINNFDKMKERENIEKQKEALNF